jgi:hypothetical protein
LLAKAVVICGTARDTISMSFVVSPPLASIFVRMVVDADPGAGLATFMPLRSAMDLKRPESKWSLRTSRDW